MKNLLFITLLTTIIFTSCGPKEPFPADDCFFSYTFLDVEYLQENIETYSGLESTNLLINQSFDNGGNITIIVNDWEEKVGESAASFQVRDKDGTNYYPEAGTVNITLLEDDHYSGTFVDGQDFLKNGTFTLRYSSF